MLETHPLLLSGAFCLYIHVKLMLPNCYYAHLKHIIFHIVYLNIFEIIFTLS